MGQHAKRFDAVGAQKGSGLAAVVEQLKTLADVVEEWYDPNDPYVVNSMQRFEMGLNQLKMAGARADDAPTAPEKPATGRRPKGSATPKSAKDEENDAAAS